MPSPNSRGSGLEGEGRGLGYLGAGGANDEGRAAKDGGEYGGVICGSL